MKQGTREASTRLVDANRRPLASRSDDTLQGPLKSDEGVRLKNQRHANRGVVRGPSGMSAGHLRPYTAFRKPEGERRLVVGDVASRHMSRTVVQQFGPASQNKYSLTTKDACEVRDRRTHCKVLCGLDPHPH